MIIKDIQRKAGVKQDGIWGRGTSEAIKTAVRDLKIGSKWFKTVQSTLQGAPSKCAGAATGGGQAPSTAPAASGVAGVLQNLKVEDLRRVYTQVIIKTKRDFESKGVDPTSTDLTVRQFLPVITPNQFGNSMDVVKKQIIMRLENILDKGIQVQTASGKDVSFSDKDVEKIISSVLRREALMQESKTYDIKFDKWSKLWK